MVRIKDDGTLCCVEGLVMNWGEPISHLYYDQDTELVMVAWRLLDSINNSTCSQWGIEHVDW